MEPFDSTRKTGIILSGERIEMIAQKNHWKHRWGLLAVGLFLLVSLATLIRFQYVETKADAVETAVTEESTVSESTVNYVPLEKFPSEPKAFLEKVQSLGEKLVAETGEILDMENLSPEEQSAAIEAMLWGLKFRYGDDWDVFSEKLFAFCDFLTDERFHDPYARDFHLPWRHLLERMATRLATEENIRLEDFEKICDALVRIREKYRCSTEDRSSDFTTSSEDFTLISHIADVLDPDATRGFVQLAAEKLGLDPDKPIEPRRTFDDRVYGKIRQTRLLGNELEMSGVDKDGKTVDLKQFRGKPVLMVASQKFSETTRRFTDKLHALLAPEGLVMLKVQQDVAMQMMAAFGDPPKTDRPIRPDEVAEFPGTVVKSSFHDFYHCMTFHSGLMNPNLWPGEGFCLFLIDPQGKVMRQQNNGYDAAFCTDLKTLFPAKATEISALQSEIQANQDDWTNEKNKRNVVYQSKNLDPVKKRLLSLYEVIDMGANDHYFQLPQLYTNVRSADSSWHQWYFAGLVFPAFQDFPDFPEVSPELRFRILWTKVKAKRMENAYRCLGDPGVQPEIVSKPLNDEIKKWREDEPNHPFWYDFYSLRRDTIRWLMMDRLRKLPNAEKKDYAEIVIQELVALAEEILPVANPETDSVGQDYRIIVPELLKEFRDIDASLVEKLKKQFSAVIFATSMHDEQLLHFAIQELR